MGVSAVNIFTLLAGGLVGLSGVQSGLSAIAFTLIALALPGRLCGTTARATQIEPNRPAIVARVDGAGLVLESSVNGEVDLARALGVRGRIHRDPFEVRFCVRLIQALGGKGMRALHGGARALLGALALHFVFLDVEVGRVSLTLPDGGILPVPAAVMFGGSRFTRAHSCPSDFSLGKKRLRDHRFGCARGAN
jgi:hypothetical protein